MLLPLSCDTDNIDWNRKMEIRADIFRKYEISGNDFIIVTGGKLDAAKNTHNLIEAVGELNKKNVKLLVFGSIADEYKQKLCELIEKYSDKVKYMGFLNLDEIYDIYLAADLAVFPGSQSALWQQAIACGLPTVFQKWPNIDYLDVGGNCIFINGADWQEIKTVLQDLVSDENKINKMKEVARTKGYKRFSYREVAEQSLH
jgi:1,2-diacylglycerol 3-alpha-glucosyltransferase